MRGAQGFRQLLRQPGIIVAPGAYDAVSARLVEHASFDAVYIGSYSTAASRLDLPDAGLLSMREAGLMVGRDGIEPPTPGFSVPARQGA